MTQVSGQTTSETEPAQQRESEAVGRLDRFRRRRLLSRVSIQSKLILMLVLCTVLAAAVVGAIAFQVGRSSLRTAVPPG